MSEGTTPTRKSSRVCREPVKFQHDESHTLAADRIKKCRMKEKKKIRDAENYQRKKAQDGEKGEGDVNVEK